MGDFFMKQEEFKNFVRTKPELIKYVQNGEMTWQKFYELYDLYGTDDKVWNKYILSDRTPMEDSISKISDMVKKYRNNCGYYEKNMRFLYRGEGLEYNKDKLISNVIIGNNANVLVVRI